MIAPGPDRVQEIWGSRSADAAVDRDELSSANNQPHQRGACTSNPKPRATVQNERVPGGD